LLEQTKLHILMTACHQVFLHIPCTSIIQCSVNETSSTCPQHLKLPLITNLTGCSYNDDDDDGFHSHCSVSTMNVLLHYSVGMIIRPYSETTQWR